MLSENIAKYRLAKGISQDEMANKLNVVRQTVSKWEKGMSIPSADILNDIAKMFGVSMEELMKDETIKELNEENFSVVEKTFYEIIKEHSVFRPEAIAFTENDVDYTYKDLKQAVDNYTLNLIERGVKPGDHIALWSYNSYSWIVSMLSIIRAGGVAILVNYSLPISDVVPLLKYADVKFVAYGENRDLRKGSDALVALKEGLSIGDNQLISINEEINKPASGKLEDFEDQPKRTAVMMFTSGTSADPKAVMLSQYSMLNCAVAQAHIIGKRIGNTSITALPFFHSFGMQTLLTYLFLGYRQIIISALKPDIVLELIDKYKISDLFTVASVYLALIDLPSFRKSVEPYVRVCVIGGAVAKANHMIRLEKAFSNAAFMNGYGQTESSPGISLTRADDPTEKKLNTVGRPFPGIEVKIADDESAFRGENETGEIIVKGYNLMNGYYKLEQDRQAIDKDGWLHTGDLGYFDEDGYLHFEGRLKDIIIKNGENIAPKEVENEILKYEGVIDAKVFGAPHAVWGESIEACLCVREGVEVDEESLTEMLKGVLAPYKIPSHYFVYNSFPTQSNGKLNQRALKADMLIKLRELNITKGLKTGISTISTTVSALPYSIEMITHMLESIGENLDYENRKLRRISKAASAWMTERIYYSKQSVGSIVLKVVFYEDRLRVAFEDNGNFLNVEKHKSKNPNLMIIDDCADAFFVVEQQKTAPVYCMEFSYDQDFDIKKYLLHYGSDGSSLENA